MPIVAINGQGGQVNFGGTNFCVSNWNADADVDVLDTTTVCSAGWQENINGIKKVEGTLEIPWDSSASPTVQMVPGALASIVLTIGATAKSFTGSARISKIGVKNEAKGVVTFSASFVSTGPWVFPT